MICWLITVMPSPKNSGAELICCSTSPVSSFTLRSVERPLSRYLRTEIRREIPDPA